MLKREISYEDLEGNTITDTFYFNLTRTEWLELESAHGESGIGGFFKKVGEAKDYKRFMDEFQRIILMAYGVKSEDGKRFIKNDQLREEFKQTFAYDVLFMDIATNEGQLLGFFKGITPKEFSTELDKLILASATASQLSAVPDAPTEPKE